MSDSIPAAIELRGFRSFAVMSAFLLLGFSWPLFQLMRFALDSDLYSYLLLIPYVSAFLIQTKRFGLASILNSLLLLPLIGGCLDKLKGPGHSSSGPRLHPIWTITFFVAGCGMLMVYLFNLFSASHQIQQDTLALAIYSLVLLLVGICCWFLDRLVLGAIGFPLAFLILLAPLPVMAETSLETFLQHGSSLMSQFFFQIIGTPVFRNGTLLQLPGFTMQVAPECSGIHSTLALFITSLVAGQILLRSNWNRTVLAAAVLPIALLRNGLRVTTIGELCVRIGPEMIDSYIHRHGGPIFFALSLIPFSLLLLLLIKYDRKGGSPVNPIA